MKDDVLIKIQVSDEDRETLAEMLDYAVFYAHQWKELASIDNNLLLISRKLEKFKELRQRIVFEEKEKSE